MLIYDFLEDEDGDAEIGETIYGERTTRNGGITEMRWTSKIREKFLQKSRIPIEGERISVL